MKKILIFALFTFMTLSLVSTAFCNPINDAAYEQAKEIILSYKPETPFECPEGWEADEVARIYSTTISEQIYAQVYCYPDATVSQVAIYDKTRNMAYWVKLLTKTYGSPLPPNPSKTLYSSPIGGPLQWSVENEAQYVSVTVTASNYRDRFHR